MTRAQRRQPNMLVIMSDEHGPMFSSTYGHRIVRTPHMDALGANGVVFDAAYCNSPLCVPSRASFMAGKHVHRVGAWDNGAPFPSETVTWAHLLRGAGYEVVLDGKMHFVGPDTLHGFQAQLTQDAHRERPDATITGREWQEPHPPGRGQVRRRIEEAGPGRAHHLDFDDEVEAAALDWLRDPARRSAPWALVTGFLAPHFPLIVPEPYFSQYYPDNVDMPVMPPGHVASQHPAHQRVRQTFQLDGYTAAQVRTARAAYYGLVTYMDEKIGRLVAALQETGQLEDTVVVYTADHGEFAGDHGLWWKNDFYEQASRVPLIVSCPGRLPRGRRFAEAVSLVDLSRTLVDLAGAASPNNQADDKADDTADDVSPADTAPNRAVTEDTAPDDMDGDSLLPVLAALEGQAPPAAAWWKDEAIVEYYGHATNRPQRMIRSGRWKYAYYHREAPELYDLSADPQELHSLAGTAPVAAVETALRRRVLAGWDPDAVERAVRRSQRARQHIGRATRP